jgi:hypothetical protein
MERKDVLTSKTDTVTPDLWDVKDLPQMLWLRLLEIKIQSRKINN